MSNKISFYNLKDVENRPNVPGAVSFGTTGEAGRLYIHKDETDYLVGESLDRLNVGSGNNVTVDYGAAIGTEINVDHKHSCAMGITLSTGRNEQVIIGRYSAPSQANVVLASGSSTTNTKNGIELYDDVIQANLPIELTVEPTTENSLIRKKELNEFKKDLSKALIYKGSATTKAYLETISNKAPGDVYTLRGDTQPVHESGRFNNAGLNDTTIHLVDEKQYLTKETYEWLKYYTTPQQGLMGTWRFSEPFAYGDSDIMWQQDGWDDYVDYAYWDGYIPCNFTSNGETFCGIRGYYVYSDNPEFDYLRPDGSSLKVYVEGAWIDTAYQLVSFGDHEELFDGDFYMRPTDPIRRLQAQQFLRAKFLAHAQIHSAYIPAGTWEVNSTLFEDQALVGYSTTLKGLVSVFDYTDGGQDYYYDVPFDTLNIEQGVVQVYLTGEGFQGYHGVYTGSQLKLEAQSIDNTMFSNVLPHLTCQISNAKATEFGYKLTGSFDYNTRAVAELGMSGASLSSRKMFFNFISNNTYYAGIDHSWHGEHVEYYLPDGIEDLGKEFVYTLNGWEELGTNCLALEEVNKAKLELTESLKGYTDGQLRERVYEYESKELDDFFLGTLVEPGNIRVADYLEYVTTYTGNGGDLVLDGGYSYRLFPIGAEEEDSFQVIEINGTEYVSYPINFGNRWIGWMDLGYFSDSLELESVVYHRNCTGFKIYRSTDEDLHTDDNGGIVLKTTPTSDDHITILNRQLEDGTILDFSQIILSGYVRYNISSTSYVEDRISYDITRHCKGIPGNGTMQSFMICGNFCSLQEGDQPVHTWCAKVTISLNGNSEFRLHGIEMLRIDNSSAHNGVSCGILKNMRCRTILHKHMTQLCE